MEASATYESTLRVDYRLTEAASNRVAWTESVVSQRNSGIDLASANEAAGQANLTRMLKEMVEFSKLGPQAH
jgi:hypothetical protein